MLGDETMEKEEQLPEYVVTAKDRNALVEAEIRRQKGHFMTDFLELKKKELGLEKFEQLRSKLAEEGGKLYDLAREGKREYYELEEQAHRQLMDWKQLETPLRKWLGNEAQGKGWTEDQIERTVSRYKAEFERSQRIIKARAKAAEYSEEEDFRKRILNPATRKEAIKRFLSHHVHKDHFRLEAIEILWSELDKLKRR